MTDTATPAWGSSQQPASAEPAGPISDAAPATPPWGNDFNAERAWNLIQNLRGDKDKLTARAAEIEAKLAGAKSQEDYEAAVAELKATNTKLERDLLVASVGAELPGELRELLKGDTEAELRAHAEVLKKFVPATGGQGAPPASLQGGLDPSVDPDAFDPQEFATSWQSGWIARASVSGRTY